MSTREVPRTSFPNLVPTLFDGRTVVAFTPTTSDTEWAVAVTWEAARAAATGNRKVLLVDLHLDKPALNPGASTPLPNGIVDAFRAGASLTDVASEQSGGLYYIGVGSAPEHPDAVWSHERWRRLARGFQVEGALLILYTPASALPQLGVDLDGIVLLSPAGYDASSPAFPGLRSRLDGGTELLAVVRNQRAGRAPIATPPRRAPFLPPPRPPASRRSLRAALLIIAAIVVAIALMMVLAKRRARSSGITPASAPAPNEASHPRGDSLFYSVQVAAFDRPDQATAYAARFGDAGGATVSPVRQGRQGLWYRVVVGVLPTPGAAETLLRRLWDEGAVEPRTGTILRTPQAYTVARGTDAAAAAREAAGLRRRGVPAYIVAAPDGSFDVLYGAFESTDQARVADSLLKVAGFTGTLVQRTGNTP